MVTIKLFGSMRLKCGVKTMEADVSGVKDACKLLSEQTNMPEKEFKNCLFRINGEKAKYSSSLKDGDELTFLTPSGGG